MRLWITPALERSGLGLRAVQLGLQRTWLHGSAERNVVSTHEMHLFHKLWTKAVGTPGYDKSEWQALERQLSRALDAQRVAAEVQAAEEARAHG